MKDYLSELWVMYDDNQNDSPDDRKAEDIRQTLSTTLTKEQRSQLLSMINLTDSVRGIESYNSFVAGLKLGIGLMAQLDEPSIEP